MKIEKQGIVKFEDLKVGQVFEWDGTIFIKSYDPTGSGRYLMVNLDSGYANSPLTDNSAVILYKNAKVVFE